MSIRYSLFRLLCLTALLFPAGSRAAEAPAPDTVKTAMRKATQFMFDKLSNQGGFVWWYTCEGLVPYGELKGRPSMIWVEPPSTPSVGLALLDAYEATRDAYYLDGVKRVADALIRGQHPEGGWHYFVDFDPQGTHAYWESFFSKCWGWQEHMVWHTNCTFDDFATSESTRFLMRLCRMLDEPRYVQARDKALNFVLKAQFENGAWPQRFPLEDDYSADYTFNDSVIADCIALLLEAHDLLGDARFEQAARKGMDFYLLAQLPEPQPGWAQQYAHDLRPGWGRPFEMDTVCAGQTYDNINDLMRFFKITGDKKYLDAIPRALDWLDRVRFKDAKTFTHTYFYEKDTNKPLYIKQTGTTVDDVKFAITEDPKGCYPYGDQISIPVAQLRAEYARLNALTPEAARAEYQKEHEANPLPADAWGYYCYRVMAQTQDTPEGVTAILSKQDANGLWPEEVSQLDPYSPFTAAPMKAQGYTTGGYVARMYRLAGYLKKATR